MVADLTQLPVSNASLLDEGTAAAEAMHLMHSVHPDPSSAAILVSQHCFPQTIEVVKTRAAALGWKVVVGNPSSFDYSKKPFGVLLQHQKQFTQDLYRRLFAIAPGAKALFRGDMESQGQMPANDKPLHY